MAASRVVLVAPTMAASRVVLVALAARPALAAVAGGYPSGPSRVAPAIVGNWGDAWTVLWPFFAVWLGTGLAVAYYALGKALRARHKPLSKTPVKARRSSTVTVAPPQEDFSTAQDVAGATRRKSASSVDLEGVELSPTRNPVLDDAVDDEAPAAAPEKIEMRGLRETKAGTAAYAFVVAFQYLSSSAIFSLGSKYRKPIWENKTIVAMWVGFAAFLTFLLLSPQNAVTELFHIASQPFNEEGTASPVWEDYQEKKASRRLEDATLAPTPPPGDAATSPGMSFGLRFELFALVFLGLAVNLAFEKVVIQGPVNVWCRKFFSYDDRVPPRL